MKSNYPRVDGKVDSAIGPQVWLSTLILTFLLIGLLDFGPVTNRDYDGPFRHWRTAGILHFATLFHLAFITLILTVGWVTARMKLSHRFQLIGLSTFGYMLAAFLYVSGLGERATGRVDRWSTFNRVYETMLAEFVILSICLFLVFTPVWTVAGILMRRRNQEAHGVDLPEMLVVEEVKQPVGRRASEAAVVELNA